MYMSHDRKSRNCADQCHHVMFQNSQTNNKGKPKEKGNVNEQNDGGTDVADPFHKVIVNHLICAHTCENGSGN